MSTPHRLGPATRLLLTLLVTPDLREGFEGDLLEEQELRRANGESQRAWPLRQLLRSAPGLLAQQARARDGRELRCLVAIALGVSFVLALVNGVFSGPPLGALVISAGIAGTTSALVAQTVALRLFTLASGTALLLVGLALSGPALGESAYLLCLFPGYLVTLQDGRRQSCRRRRPEVSK